MIDEGPSLRSACRGRVLFWWSFGTRLGLPTSSQPKQQLDVGLLLDIVIRKGRFSFALGGFCHFLPFNGFLCNFLSFSLLWAASAKNAEKVVISRFPSDFAHVTNKSKWHMAYFLCNVQGFPLLWAASAKMLMKKLQFPCFSHCSKASLL